jgi:small subunit ribosomal protein S9
MAETQNNFVWATGRRKTAVASVRMLSEGNGKILVNSKDLNRYFGGHERYKAEILQVMKLIPEATKYNFYVKVTGGGIMGQAEAIRHGIARALSKYSESYRPKLKEAGLLTRDPRMVERKKSGMPKARKRFQWTKR